LYRCWQLSTTIWTQVFGKIIMTATFYHVVICYAIVNFVVIRSNDMNVIVRLSMLSVSITVILVVLMGIRYKAKQYELSEIALKRGRSRCVSSKLCKQMLRSCSPCVSKMGSFYKIDRDLALLFIYLVFYNTVTLLVTFKN